MSVPSVVNTNIKSMVAQDSLSIVNRKLSTAMERLSTGNRINSAKDDAAGLAISTRMEAQSRGLSMAIRNANDGISLMQTAEGAMDEVTNMLQRMRELAVQSANGVNNAADRRAIDAEVQQLKTEIDRVANTTEFNNMKILDGSFKGKKLQIGDKAYQTMDIAVGSVKTKDLGMGTSGFGGDVLVGTRALDTSPTGLLTVAVDAGDIRINDQALEAMAVGDDLGKIIDNINKNVDNVTASGFNTVVAKNVGTGVVTNAQLSIQVRSFNTNASTTFSISAAETLSELVDNINKESNNLVRASINDMGKVVLENDTGATIIVTDTSASGLGFGVANAQTFNGFLKLEAKDNNDIRIERGNLGKTAPGTLSDLALLGFRETTREKSNEAYTVTGDALTSSNVGTSWNRYDLKINGVEIYDADVATDSFAGKLNAINNFTDQTGVFATARFDKAFTVPAEGFVAGKHIQVNGAFINTGADKAAFVTNFNAKTSEHGLVATLNGDNFIITGQNVQKMNVEYVDAAYGNMLQSSVTATGAATIARTVTLVSADIVVGRTIQLSAATSGGTGNFSVVYTMKANDTKTSVAVALKERLLATQRNYSGAAFSGGASARYLGTNTATTITVAAAKVDLKLSGANYGIAAIDLKIVDGPSSTISNYQTRINTAVATQAAARTVTFRSADIQAGKVYELRVVSGERVGPTGSSFVVRVTATASNNPAALASAFAAAIRDTTGGAYVGQANTFNRNGLTSATAVTVAGGVLTLAANTGYGRASIHFYAVDEVLGAKQTHFGEIRLDSVNNTPISIALGDAANVVERTGFLEVNVGAADYQINTPTLGVAFGSSLSGLNVTSAASASKAIGTIDNAIEKVSSMRADLGAMQNRLVSTVNNLDNIVTNTEASRSRIKDTDYAVETTNLAKAQIIQQAATAMLAQANQQAQSVLALLQ